MKQVKDNYKILFIDDSKTEVKYLKLLFDISELPAEPTFINSAIEALEFLDGLDDLSFPDIIMVDINMPLMNGFEFSEKYYAKHSSGHPNTMLYIYSTSINSADVRKAESLDGVKGFISKPFDENSFNNILLPNLEIQIGTKN